MMSMGIYKHLQLWKKWVGQTVLIYLNLFWSS